MSSIKYTDDNGLLYLIQKIKTLLGTKVDKETGKGLSTNDYTNADKTIVTGIDGRVTTLENAGYQTAGDVQTLINSSLASVMTYKGTVANYSDLPSSNIAVGDTYNITNASEHNNAGDNATWNGASWDVLGSNIDLSSYLQDSDLVAITNAEIDTMWNGN